MSNLKTKAIGASYWTISVEIISQFVRLVTNLVLTRLLVPEMFGLMAIVNVILVGLNLFSDLGLSPNVVQSKRGEDKDFLNTIWVTQFFRGGLLCILAVLIGGLVYLLQGFRVIDPETVYGDTLFPFIIMIMAISPLVSGFNSTNIMSASRELKLSRISIMTITTQVVSSVTMIVLAYQYRSIWALVIGTLVGACLTCFLSHSILASFRNSFHWNQKYFWEIFHFGKWIFISTILAYVINQSDRLYLAGNITPGELGVYSIAFYLSSSVLMIIGRLYGGVFFPALCDVCRTNSDNLSNVYYKLRFRVDFLAYVSFGIIFVAGSEMIEFLYDERYASAGWMLELLSISLLSIGFLLAEQCLIATGQVKLTTFGNLLHALLLIIGLPLSFAYGGLKGVVLLYAISPTIRAISAGCFLYRSGLINLKKELLALPFILVGIFLGYLASQVLTRVNEYI